MSWPLRLRATSFAVTAWLTLVEGAIVSVPLGLFVWIAGWAPAGAIVETAAAISAAYALGTAIATHARPPRLPAGNGRRNGTS